MNKNSFKQRFQNVRFGSVLAKGIAALLLFDASDARGYDSDHYTLLRLIACGVSAFAAFQAAQLKKFGWLFVFIVVTIALNPIAPLHLKRETWRTVDAAAGALFLVAIAVIDIRKRPLPSLTGEIQGGSLSDQREDFKTATSSIEYSTETSANKMFPIERTLLIICIVGLGVVFVVWAFSAQN